MINYFYNIKLKSECFDFYSDVLTNIRKDYYLSKLKQKGKLTQNSDSDYISYEFCLEKDKMLKWLVSDNKSIISESKRKEDGKYCVDYYENNGSSKSLVFSKYHTLLKVEYYDNKISTSPNCTIEPRKNNDDLCLLLSNKSSYESTVLLPMPIVEDEYILEKIESEFSDYTAVASTNIGVVKFLSNEQIKLFEDFIVKAEEQKKIDTAQKSYIDEKDAELANMMNPKDFNIKKNLSQALDITMAEEFAQDVDDVVAEIVGENYFNETSEPDFIDFVAQCYNNPITQEHEVIQNEEENIDIPVEESEVLNVFESDFSDDDAFEKEVKINSEISDSVSEENEPSYETEIEQIFEEDVLDDFDDVIEMATDTTSLTYEHVEEASDVFEDDEELEESGFNEETVEELSFEESKNNVSDTYDDIDGVENLTDEESFDVEQQEIPDCIIESASARYLYFGELDEKGKRSGFGRTSSENGRTTYEGNYVDNKREGLGAYYYKDGELCYYGEWKDNKRDGFGIGISSVDKSAHIGRFVNNKSDSNGVRVDRNGEIRFVRKQLSDGTYVVVKFDGDKVILTKHSENGDVISENTTNMMYF